jgi:serine/threonine protein kinase
MHLSACVSVSCGMSLVSYGMTPVCLRRTFGRPVSQHPEPPKGEPRRAQILHCDIKSGNILLGRGGVAKIAGAPRVPRARAVRALPRAALPCRPTRLRQTPPCRHRSARAWRSPAAAAGSAMLAFGRGGGPRLTRRARADVGLAKLLSSAQTMASAVGTFDWAAPEILAGAPVRRAWTQAFMLTHVV